MVVTKEISLLFWYDHNQETVDGDIRHYNRMRMLMVILVKKYRHYNRNNN